MMVAITVKAPEAIHPILGRSNVKPLAENRCVGSSGKFSTGHPFGAMIVPLSGVAIVLDKRPESGACR